MQTALQNRAWQFNILLIYQALAGLWPLTSKLLTPCFAPVQLSSDGTCPRKCLQIVGETLFLLFLEPFFLQVKKCIEIGEHRSKCIFCSSNKVSRRRKKSVKICLETGEPMLIVDRSKCVQGQVKHCFSSFSALFSAGQKCQEAGENR